MDKLDELNFRNDKNITKQFENDETILISTKISKYNERNKKQERSFLLTTKYIYNISKATIKRKISTKKIMGITVSKLANEFVLHVPEEYDYRYAHPERNFNLIEMIF